MVPDTFGIDHHVGTELAAVETPGGVYPDIFDAERPCFLTHVGAQFFAAAGAAAAARMPLRADIRAAEYMATVKERRVGRRAWHSGSPCCCSGGANVASRRSGVR